MTMGFQLSPGVQTKEFDLSTSIPAVATSLGATVGRFTWGPCFDATLVASESNLVSVFGKPNADSYPSFLTSAAFLSYSNSLQVVRVVDATATNANASGTGVLIKNAEDFDTQMDSGTLTEGFYARYPGAYGNSITVETADEAGYATWAYAGAFDVSPAASNSEMAIAVLVGGVVAEAHIVSTVDGNKNADGNNIFVEKIINDTSKLILAVNANVANGTASTVFANGADSGVGEDDYKLGWDLFANADEINVSILVAGGVTNEAKATAYAVQKYMVESIAEVRKDCFAMLSPAKEDVVNVGGASTAVSNVIASRKDVSFNVASSYGSLDANYKYTYDKYNDTYRWIGFSGDTAGLLAYTDSTRDAWWSPAGLNRGQIKNVVKLAYNPSSTLRDQLYMLPNGINPIVSFPGQGTVLWGDRTLLTKPSAFDRINVRRLFIVIEKAIAISAKYFLFEFNNKYTRRNFVNMVNPYLGGIQGKQGMYDFYVQCDETNNTGEVIDANQFVASMFIKPAKSINYITLNFVATKTGVDFSEVIGQV
jgi:hypothetical protein